MSLGSQLGLSGSQVLSQFSRLSSQFEINQDGGVMFARPGGFSSAQTSGYSVSNSGGMVLSSGGEEYRCHSSSLHTARVIIKDEMVLLILAELTLWQRRKLGPPPWQAGLFPSRGQGSQVGRGIPILPHGPLIGIVEDHRRACGSERLWPQR